MTSCPHCGHALIDPIEAVRQAAQELCLDILPGGFLNEVDTAELLNLSPTTLRKQVNEHRMCMDFIRRGNRRFYRLSTIAEHYF